ncbi:MAG: amino acid ABC transporter substrate-binding protein [Solirubrobacterales bacterium]|nr:amino acid ABC transporter substrate-binding protein [Solirubrobacterales bacterium]
MKSRIAFLTVPVLAVALLAGCASDSSDSNGSNSGQTASLDDCQKGKITTYKDGVITVGTDSPAYPPYFEDNDPSNGKGFESAVAYAIADRLGFSRSAVEWTVVPFNASYAPGPKKFDFDVNQISITPAREKAVSFSIPYYTANQAVLVTKDSDIGQVSGLDELQDLTIGVQVGTTSLAAVEDQIDPSSAPKVYDNSNDVVSALKQGQVDAVVVDLPTAIYLRDVEVPNSEVAGQFKAPGGDKWGALLAKDSNLTKCVNAALSAMKDDGTLEEITTRWMSDAASAPELN